MIFADFITDIGMALVLVMAILWVPVILLKMAAAKLTGHVRKDYRRKGGAKALLLQGSGRTAGKLFRRWLFGR